MATYGYAGDFSSDDDEKIEQVQVPAKYDDSIRPSKSQVEDAIDFIKKLPYDRDVSLTDEMLAGLLDYYKTQRGPIVDSTRKLYHKIALRLVRGDLGKESAGSDGVAKETNGNNNVNLLGKGASQQSAADTFSSDEEEIDGADNRLKSNAKKFDSRVVYNNNNVVDLEDEDQMEVDSEAPSVLVRDNKPIELSTTTDEDDDSSNTSDDDDSSENGDDPNSESDVLEVTPIKPPASATREKEAIEVLMAMRPSTPKQTESSLKRQPLAHSTPKESFVETAKKPYTRSQRITTRSATKSTRDVQRADNKNSSSSSADVFIEKKRTSRMNYTVLSVSLLVFLVAFFAYYYVSNILTATEPLFRKKVTF